MSVEVTSSLNQASAVAMSPITNYPQSPGGGGAESFSSRSKRAASPQRVSNGYASPKSNLILSPRKSSKRFFRRPTLEKNQSSDCSTQGNEKKKQSNSHPRVEIIYKDASSGNESDKETMVSSLKKAFEADGTQSSYSEDGSPSTLSEQPASHCLDVNMNRISTASGSSHTERVVQEIVLTEQAYVSHLQEIIEGYLKKMRNDKSPFSELDIKDLFMNIEEIYEFNKSFLAELEICGDDPVEVANLFVSKETGFVTYTEYCTNYPISMEVLTKSTQKKETAEFIKKIQVELGHSLPLGSYLLKPVQRILKYHLLLQDIQKHFDKENDPEGYNVISDALSAMTGVAHHINEMKRQHEVAVHVQEIQSQMCDFEGPDLTTYGSLVLEDTFRMHGTRTDRYLFLFEQILLITKRKENGYSCKATLMLSNMMMLESVPKEPLAFQIIRFDNQKITYTFLARNKDQKRQWMLELKRLIVDSLSAQVPTKAKNLILGKKSVGETKELETPDTEGKKRSSSIDSKLNRGAQLKGSSGFTGMKREKVSIKSDDESEPRSPSEAYSSDDDKKLLRSHSSVSDREESLDECEEPVEEKRRNSDHRVSTPIHESSEDEAEEKLLNHEAPEAQPRAYSVQDSRGEVVGRATTEGVGFVSQIKNDEQSEAEVINTTLEGVTTSSGIRQRSSSLSSCDSVKEARNRKIVTRNGSFNNKAPCEVGSFAHVSSDSPSQIRRSSSGIRLLEARRSLEKSSSALDLRDVDEDSASAFSHGDIENFMEYSTIQTTVRKVSRAFSGSSPPPDKTSPSEIQMRTAQTRYILESRITPDKDSSASSSDSTQQNLEELLASIDRDLDETRRTISCAQLLESALLIKNDGRPLNTETKFTNSLTRKRRPRIIDFTTEKSEPQLDKSRSSFSDERSGEREQSEHVNCLRGEACTNTTVYSEQEKECNSSGEKNNKDKQELSISNDIEQSQAFALSAGSEPQGDQVDESSQAVDQNQPQKRVFELFADSKSEKSKPSTAIEEDVFEETATHVITPKKSSLPSVHKMARQYSRKVAEKQTVENIRTRALKRLEVAGPEAKKGPQWSESEPPPRIVMPEDDETWEPHLELQTRSEVGMKDVPTGLSPRSMAAHSPARRKSKKITEISREKMSDVNEEILDTQTNEYYSFGESTWDLVMFIGTGALGPMGSLETLLLAVVNVLMQVVFVAIAYFNFTKPDVDETSVVDAQRWRRASGHSMWSYSEVSKESLAERVCKLDKSLEQSGIQVALYENIEKYLKSGTSGLEGYFTGQVLCIVALICWYLMVAKELSHALALLRGVLAMPTGPTRIDTRENPFTKAVHYRLRCVAFRRKVFSTMLFCYRLLAAGVLVFVGTFFLVYTVSVTELILNAVALGIILDIDDLLFDALATTPGRHLVHQLDALPMPSLPRVRGADAKSVFMSIGIPCLTILVYVSMLGPFVGTLQEVSLAMCGGNLGFVWNVDKRRVVLMAPTVGGGWEDQDATKVYAVEEGERIGYGLEQADAKYGVWLSDVSLVGDLTTLSLAESIDLFNPECGDVGDAEPMLHYLRFFLQNESIQGCADAAPFCTSISSLPDYGVDDGKGWATRMLCSETCGCRNPAGENLLVQGCPYGSGRACQVSESFLEQRQNGVCLEKNASSLQQFAPWVQWIEALTSYGNQSATLAGKQEALVIAQAMWDHGCDFQANLNAQNISWGNCFKWNSSFGWDFKTLEVFCPLSCGCSVQTLDSSCPQPFGFSCDELDQERCLTWNQQHYCPGHSPSVEGALTMTSTSTDPTEMAALFVPVQLALVSSLAYFSGAQSHAVRLDLAPRGSLIVGSFSIFLVDETWNIQTLSSNLFSTSVDIFEARVFHLLAAQGVNTTAAGIDITSLGRPSLLPDLSRRLGPGDIDDRKLV